MLGRTSFTRDEVDNARRGMEEQLAAYRALTAAIAATPDDDGVATALAAFETRFATDLLPALDRPFVHRVRMVTGKDTNPLNEVEFLVDSLMTNDSVLVASTVHAEGGPVRRGSGHLTCADRPLRLPRKSDGAHQGP